MPYYQDTSGGLHVLSAEDIANGGLSLLPPNCTPITDAQAAALLAPPTLTAAQVAAATAASAMAAGLAITSTSTPALNGTYPVDEIKQTQIGQVEVYIQKNGKFPGSSGTSLAWFDISGTAHIFTSTALFSEFATAVADYVADLDLYGASAPGATLPAASITIA